MVTILDTHNLQNIAVIVMSKVKIFILFLEIRLRQSDKKCTNTRMHLL